MSVHEVSLMNQYSRPSIARIGLRLPSVLPDVGPMYPTSEVLNTTDWWGQIFPQGFRGT